MHIAAQHRRVDFGDFLTQLGQNVRRARWRRGLTQQQLAGESFSTRYIADVERGARNVSMKTVFDLAGLLGVRVVDLLNVGERGRAIDLSKVSPATAPRPGRKPARPAKLRR